MTLSRIQYPSPGFSQHWQQAAGKRMLRRIGTRPSEKDIEAFNALYSDYDTQADAVVQDLFDRYGHGPGFALLDKLLSNGPDYLEQVPPSLQQLYTTALQVPDWLNEDLLAAGAAFCRRSGPFGLIVLRNYSLMGGYESAAINKPLIYTGALKSGPAKRLSETLSFWVDVTGEGALQAGAVGFNSVLKVRLLHAMARVYTRRATDWSDERWGAPINQGDMVATYLGFSLVFLDGLYRLGFRPTKKESDGLFHLWKYIGHLLGIPAQHLPDTEAEAIRILYQWTMTQPPADEDTKALAAALMNAPLSAPFPPKAWQKRLLVKIYLGFNQYFLGKQACQRMGLPRTVFRYLPYLPAAINRLHELLVFSSEKNYRQSVNNGRRQQENIREAFVKGYEAQKATTA